MRKKYGLALGTMLMLSLVGCQSKDSPVVYDDVNILGGDNSISVSASVLIQDQESYVELEDTGEGFGAEIKVMSMNMDLTDYIGEVILSLTNPQWQQMATEAMENKGIYGYCYTMETGDHLYVKAGMDESGSFYTLLQLKRIDGTLRILRQTENAVLLFESENVGGNGNFEVWLLDGLTGNMYYEAGQLAGGKIQEGFCAKVHKGAGQTSVYTMWCNRDSMEYETITDKSELDISFYGIDQADASLSNICRIHEEYFLKGNGDGALEGNTQKEPENQDQNDAAEDSKTQETKPDDMPYDTQDSGNVEEWSPDIL
ncbi:MAG: hypothetical protein ACI4AQ_09760 [Lachnospiraceae bacterium]